MHAGIQSHPSGHQFVSSLVSSPLTIVNNAGSHRVAHTGLDIFFFFCSPELALKTGWTTILFDDWNLQMAAQCGVVRMTDV